MMRLSKFFWLALMLVPAFLCAQSDLMVHGNSPNLHLLHTVAAKENWYSLGRTYNLSPKTIAAFNGLTIDKSLNLAQVVKVPLNTSNFVQNDNKGSDEVLVPVYHTIQEKEWMYRISVNHNKVPIEKLEQWNNISRDQAKAGTRLIVGFLKVKEGQSALASAPVSTPPATRSQPVVVAEENQPIPRETPKTETAKQESPLPPTESASSTNNPVSTAGPVNHKGGFFKGQYGNSGKNANGVSGIFRSTSGWNDGKYYALMNNVPVGTIVRVSFPSTNKSVYAKVLGQLPEMRESQGLTIRISDAAANELGAGNSRFTVDVNY